MTADEAFRRLARSKFRSRFRLSDADRRYIAEKGMATIRRHAEDFIRTRLAPANSANDGWQTPMRGHPVFKAQQATATCSALAFARLGRFPMGGRAHPQGGGGYAERQSRIVDFLMEWIATRGGRSSLLLGAETV